MEVSNGFRGGVFEVGKEQYRLHLLGREVSALAWYPAETSTPVANGPLFQEKEIDSVSLYFPDTTREVLKELTSKAGHRAPITLKALKPTPLIFIHAMKGLPQANVSVCEFLASCGYFVLAPIHPEDSVTSQSEPSIPSELTERTAWLDERLADWSRLIEALLDEWADGSCFRECGGNLSPKKVGVLGYSFGGAVARDLCVRRKEVVCGVNMDGTFHGTTLNERQHKPFLVVGHTDSESSGSAAEMEVHFSRLRRVWKQLKGPRYYATLEGTSHHHFSDFSWIARQDTRETPKYVHALSALLAAFFASHLPNTRSGDIQLPDALQSACRLSREIE